MAAIPVFSHVVIVTMENHGFGQIIGPGVPAPFINNTLVPGGAVFTGFHAPGHPSFPNYFVLVSGLTWGSAQFQVGGDKTPPTGWPFSGANIGSLLLAKSKTFLNYVENLPANHQAGDSAPYYAHHNPIPFFSNVPNNLTVDFTTFPTTTAGFAALPTVSLIIPNGNNDMHDGTVTQGDTWLNAHFSAYAAWAKLNNSLLIVWWDEDYGSADNPPEIFYGANVKAGRYPETPLSHVNFLRTLCDMYGLVAPGGAATATPVIDVWTTGPPPPPQALTIDTTSILAATAGTFYTTTLAASGGTPPFTWSVASGLPLGITINASSGVISGTAVNGGNFPFTAQVHDVGSPVQTDTQALILTVNTGPPPPPGQPSITTTSLLNAQVGTAYSVTLTGTGGTPPYAWSLIGSLPSGLALSGATLSGIPGSAGSFNLTAHLLDFAGQSATPQPLTLTVTTLPPPPPPPSGNPFATGAGVSTTMVPADVMGATLVNTLGFVAIQDVTP
jgi:acid phosphatase